MRQRGRGKSEPRLDVQVCAEPFKPDGPAENKGGIDGVNLR